jgi:hypothetical protein
LFYPFLLFSSLFPQICLYRGSRCGASHNTRPQVT